MCYNDEPQKNSLTNAIVIFVSLSCHAQVSVILLSVSEYVMALLYDGPKSKVSRLSELYTPVIDMLEIGCMSFDFMLAAGVELTVWVKGKQQLRLYHWKTITSTGWNHVRMVQFN